MKGLDGIGFDASVGPPYGTNVDVGWEWLPGQQHDVSATLATTCRIDSLASLWN